MQNKSLTSLWYSVGGVIALFIVLLAVNYLVGAMRLRADLTQGNVYTLSDGTKRILANLPGPVKIRYYASQSENAMPVGLKGYARRVEDLLKEYRQVSKGKLTLEKYDPAPDSDAEDSANLDGVEPQIINTGERFYLGLSLSQLDQKVAVPALSPERETLLEYDLTRAISQVSKTTKPTIGIMTALPMFGRGMAMPGQPPQQPWTIISELRREYTVKEVPLKTERIDDDIKVLAVIHPRDASDQALYAIDQFVLRGGKLVAFVDPYAYFDQMQNPMNPAQQMSGGNSNLDKITGTWGLKLEPNKVVADMRFMRQAGNRSLPTLLNLSAESFNSQDVVASQIGTMLLPFAGTFTGKPATGLTQTVLLKSSTSAALQEAMTATQPVDPNALTIKAANVEYPLAVRLSGKFKTAFADGKPKKAEPKKDENNPEEPPPTEEKKPDAKPEPQIKESAKDNSVVLVADADLLSDQAAVQVQDFLGQRVVIPRNGNLNFVQSLIEQFSGDENLIGLRSRAAQFRPLTVVQRMEAKAAESYAGKIKELEDSLASTQRRIGELQSQKGEGQQFILSPEQKTELDNFRKKQAETRKDLKELRRNLRTETDRLEFWTKLINVAAMPVLVALAGIALAMVKRKKVAAR
jgi:ABC-type uncharacterized transport system involved in gliding motility auxiliary subunit